MEVMSHAKRETPSCRSFLLGFRGHAVNYYPFHLGDYAAHTAHLEPLEDLAYRRMLDLYYLREQALPEDTAEIARLIRMRGNVAEVEAVLREFFELSEDGYRHARCDAEIAKMQDKQAKARASAQASVNARSTSAQRPLNVRSTDVELPTPTPIPKKEPPNPRKRGDGEPPGFQRFWAAWPSSQRKVARAQCLRRWLRAGCEDFADRVVASVEAHKASADWTKDNGGFVPAPIVWLNQSRWEAELPVSPAASSIASADAELQRAREQAARAVPPPAAVLELAKRMRVG